MHVKIIQKYKDKSVSQLLGMATKHFNEFIRLRDSYPINDKQRWGHCISSGRRLIVPSKNSHAGHFWSGGKFPALRFNEDNVHLQGKSDNFFNGGNENEYRRNLIKKIGQSRVDTLDSIAAMTKGKNHKWERIFLIEIIEKYKLKKKTV
jgi:hypothetical protein